MIAVVLLYCCLLCSLPPLNKYYYVIGEDTTKADDQSSTTRKILPRYVVEADFKPPIFGSFKYDPVLQQFTGVNDNVTRTTTSTTMPETTKTTAAAESKSPSPQFLRNSGKDTTISPVKYTLMRNNKVRQAVSSSSSFFQRFRM